MLRLSTTGITTASARHPKRVLALWALAFAGAALAIAALLGGALTSEDDFTNDPESKRAETLLRQGFVPGARDQFSVDEVVIVRSAKHAVGDPAFERRLRTLAVALRDAGAGRIVERLRTPGGGDDPELVSRDRRAALILVDLARDDVEALVETVARANGDGGFETLIVGESSIDAELEAQAEKDLQRGELVGLGLALVVLVLVFGAVVAALVPIVVAIASIVIALGLTALIGTAFQLSFFVVNMLVMMGLAVGVDYSLFVVSRYRDERAAGREARQAIAVTGATASRAVFFSGVTVVVALVGLFVVPQTVFRSLATGAIVVVVVAVAAALTLLPALLALLGDHTDRLRVPLVGGRRGTGVWAAVAEVAVRRPRVSLAASVALLVALAVPYAGIDLGSSGVSTLPDTFQTKRAFTLLEREFGVRTSTADVVVAGGARDAAVRAALRRLRALLAEDDRFGAVEVDTSSQAPVTLATVPVAGDPVGRAAVQAVRDLRRTYIPQAFAGSGVTALVAGTTAGEIDFYDTATRYQPLVVALVLTLTFVLLVAAFRSLVIPLTAIVLNLLSVGAAYGLLVLVFQHGVAADLLGFAESETVEAWLPLFLFAVLFGLSMDYHVFLLSRIREAYVAHGETDRAVLTGVRATARIITGAALIMVSVFAGFASGELAMFQQMGFGLGAAVLLDATVVRCVVVPSAMKLLGRANWYLPHRLARLPALGERVSSVERA